MTSHYNAYSTGNNEVNFRIWTESGEIPPVVWEYRGATLEEYAFEQPGIPRSKAITITGVKGLSEDGTYVIPQTINGMTVVAIAMDWTMAASWRVETVKKLYLPPTLTFFLHWGYNGIHNCYYLTDIYIAADQISISKANLPDQLKNGTVLTVHCADSCYFEDFGQTAKELFPLIHEGSSESVKDYTVQYKTWDYREMYP